MTEPENAPRAVPADPYATAVHQWWHLSQPSPELRRVLVERRLAPPGRALDLGCGLGTEAACLAEAGFTAIGIDLSAVAVRRAGSLHRSVRFAQADALHLPFASAVFDVLIDRGCFHYLIASDRPRYAAEARRVLRPGVRLFLRACLRTAGERNDIDEVTLQRVFGGWRFLLLERAAIPSDTRMMEALIALLERA